MNEMSPEPTPIVEKFPNLRQLHTWPSYFVFDTDMTLVGSFTFINEDMDHCYFQVRANDEDSKIQFLSIPIEKLADYPKLIGVKLEIEGKLLVSKRI